jgi:hypothetical protein
MNLIYPILIFVIVIFFYIHIINEYKVSEDLEVYEIDYQSNGVLQDACEIKQPVIFERPSKINFPSLESFKQTVVIKDLHDYNNNDNISVDSIELPCSSFLQLAQNDLSRRYFSENNQTFIDESGLGKIFQSLDKELKPKNVFSTKHDILLASNGVCTPFRYHTDSRRFIQLIQGSAKIKMTSKKYSKYLDEIKDYENLEFRSPINVWNINEESTPIDKIQFIEFDIPCGSIVFIPSFWWFSIKYNESNTIILECRYSNISNKLAFGFDLFRHYLQEFSIIRNYKRKIGFTSDSIMETDIPNETEEETTDLPNETEEETKAY